jgi:hypothetical protein
VTSRGPDRRETDEQEEKKIEKRTELFVAATHPPFI